MPVLGNLSGGEAAFVIFEPFHEENVTCRKSVIVPGASTVLFNTGFGNIGICKKKTVGTDVNFDGNRHRWNRYLVKSAAVAEDICVIFPNHGRRYCLEINGRCMCNFLHLQEQPEIKRIQQIHRPHQCQLCNF